MTGRSEELLIGALCAVLALLILRRIAVALRSGEVPLYRMRLKRAEAGEARFWGLVLVNGAYGQRMVAISASTSARRAEVLDPPELPDSWLELARLHTVADSAGAAQSLDAAPTR